MTEMLTYETEWCEYLSVIFIYLFVCLFISGSPFVSSRHTPQSDSLVSFYAVHEKWSSTQCFAILPHSWWEIIFSLFSFVSLTLLAQELTKLWQNVSFCLMEICTANLLMFCFLWYSISMVNYISVYSSTPKLYTFSGDHISKKSIIFIQNSL